jgi:hypothetical protein
MSSSNGKAFGMLVFTSYVFMMIAQNYGPEVIELLHGKEARLKATAPQYDDVQPDTPLQQLCEGYDAHHFDNISNCIHAAGMLMALFSLFCFFVSKQSLILLTLPPIWYLYAWVGHFLIQKDIPAVFVYGMTFRGWLSGEYCSICSLFLGRTIALPWECGLTALLVTLHLYLLPPVPGWGVFQTSKSKDA